MLELSKKNQVKLLRKRKFKMSLDKFFDEEIQEVQAKIAASSELDPELDEEHKEENLV